MKNDEEVLDCLIVGGGPAGLTASIYLARFHLSTAVVDIGRGRAAQIPISHNHAGFPNGVKGSELLDRMRIQAAQYGASLRHGEVVQLAKSAEGFACNTASEFFHARTVLIATGVYNRRPAIADDLHDAAVAQGLIRYCSICDGFEVTDRRIAVIGSGKRGIQEAEFLRSFTADITLISPTGEHELTDDQMARARTAGIRLATGPCYAFRLKGEEIGISLLEGELSFAAAYPALGSDVRSQLAVELGAQVEQDGCLVVDRHQRTNVAFLYAAGDVVVGLDQISSAMGQASVAATTMRNDIASLTPLRR